MKSCLALPALALIALPLAAQSRGIVANTASPHIKLKALDLDDVRFTEGFWAQRFDVVHRHTLPTLWKAMDDPRNGAQYASFLKTTGRGGEHLNVSTLNVWSDGDVYKAVETMALVYATTRDPAIDRRMDEIITVFAAAQEQDGYISTPMRLKGLTRWTNLRNHELYNMGHLMTAACIHHRATGKRNFLEIAIKVADYLYLTFQPRPRALAHFGFNPSNIMGSVELYRTTGNSKYLELARIFTEMRGSAPGGSDLNQTRTPLVKETEAVGHAVTAMYLYAGATDVYGETGDQPLLTALNRIWDDVTGRKMYLTGAVGNLYNGVSRKNDDVHEAFGLDYELPNRFAYNETCANIGNAMWNWRLLGLSGDARYGDTMETVLYNSLLSGMSIDGTSFYYANPLRRHGDELPRVVRRQDPALRSTVLPCYCCPTSIARTIAGLKGWAFAKSDGALWVNLYTTAQVDTALAGGRFALTEKTDYPWSGTIRFTVDKAPAGEAALMLRIPAWASGATARVGNEAPRKLQPGAYASLRRLWHAGDQVTLELPMDARIVEANPYVESTRNQVAVMRGPLVYALESPDTPAGLRLSEIALPTTARFESKWDAALLGGVIVLETEARIRPEREWSGMLYRTLSPAAARSAPIRMVPYYAWANRGMSHMTVWIPRAD
ncbi:MAG: glycoside hydrolase family 127 protein [Bryobacteraceae bacterium]